MPLAVLVLVLASGVAALSWEVLWQLQSSLALGISAKGTALTLAATMGGMSLGATLMGRALATREVKRPLRVYGSLEVVVGLSGLALLPGFALVERIDRALYAGHPLLAPLVHVLGMFLVVGPAALAMGATIPVFGMIARQARSSIAILYAANTAGASLGVLLVSFVVLPALGVELTAMAMACVNLAVAAASWLMSGAPAPGTAPAPAVEQYASEPHPAAANVAKAPRAAALVVVVSGFVSFGLEVAWFRAVRAAFLSTTHTFAIMVASVLVPLAAGARLAKWLRAKGVALGTILAAAGVAVLLATPLVERFDRLADAFAFGFWMRNLLWFGASLAVLGPSMLLLGTALPWTLEAHAEPRQWGRLYALNTLAAVAGSLGAAWLLLPAFGFARTAWLLGAVTLVAGALLLAKRARRVAAAALAGALAVAVALESGVGRTRIIGNMNSAFTHVLAFEEGPDSSVAVAEDKDHVRTLVIDGFPATDDSATAHYMIWMGRLPMLVHPAPRRALVICFGTGQTANAVRRENPESLDLVELNGAVLRMAHFFDANQQVLDDPRVHPTVMDGRAWLRRTDHRYDVITLEPMPPNFAGVNSLYSRDFYELAAERLEPGGVVAQWVPFHLLSTHDALAIAATFQAVFGDALLWIDPHDHTGILVGRKGVPSAELARAWPGLARPGIVRDMDAAAVEAQIALDPAGVARYAELGEIVTDDNQLLAYGPKRHRDYFVTEDMLLANLAIVARVAMPRPVAPRR